MAIPMMGYILALIFPIYVNVYKKDSVDPHRNTKVNIKAPSAKALELEEGSQNKPTVPNVELCDDLRVGLARVTSRSVCKGYGRKYPY